VNFKNILQELSDSFKIIKFTDDTCRIYLNKEYRHLDQFRDLVHGTEMFPGDVRYHMIHKAVTNMLDYYEDSTDFKDILIDSTHEIADSCTDVYTTELLAWLSSHIHRQQYCDEALEMSEHANFISLLSAAQYIEYVEIINNLITFCSEVE